MSKTVLITGASGGIGLATAQHFLARGWNTCMSARRVNELDSLAANPNALVVQLDVTDATQIDAAVASTLRRFGQIDVVVNNAGAGLAGAFEAMSMADLRAHFEVNVLGAMAVTKAVLPHMRQRGQGVIVNVTSVTGRIGLPLLSPYVAAKFAVEGWSESLRYELLPHGIRVKLVEPGGVRTRFAHTWRMHDAYEPLQSLVRDRMTAGTASSPGPEIVAPTIFRAATDGSQRLRYAAAGAGTFLFLAGWLPDNAVRALVTRSFAKAIRVAR
jgi:NAD(P)-dependent dehydrogenase (short-subunit alcohol dehydrogenase family)